MPKAEQAQTSTVKQGTEQYDRRRRRNGLGDIFEDMDVSLLMRKLELKASHRTSCSSCHRASEDTSLYISSTGDFTASPVTCPEVDNTPPLSRSTDRQMNLDGQCVGQEIGRTCHHSSTQNPDASHSAIINSFSHTHRNEDVDVCAAAGTTSWGSSSSRLHFQHGTSSSGSTFIMSESETGKAGAGSAATEIADNCHTMVAFRPEVCAKRSLIF